MEFPRTMQVMKSKALIALNIEYIPSIKITGYFKIDTKHQ